MVVFRLVGWSCVFVVVALRLHYIQNLPSGRFKSSASEKKKVLFQTTRLVSAEDSALGRHIAGASLYERMLCNECGG